MAEFVCAVDVGTRSARAGIFASDGTMHARDIAPLSLHEGPGQRGEYSANQIWQAVCAAIRAACKAADLAPDAVGALAFDATCSLVLRRADGSPLPLGPEGRDTIAWFDHRAIEEAAACTAAGGRMIEIQGGAMSPEMQTPKLLWLKRHRPDLWRDLAYAGDLCDWLALRASGQATRSLCAASAKWPWRPEGGWQTGFLAQLGLQDISERAGLRTPSPVGTSAGQLSAQAASETGLPAGIPVAVGLIDAFAGGLGAVGLFEREAAAGQCTLVTGTSSCLMALGAGPETRAGIWGPYPGAILPDLRVSEGGQSAAGALLDHILATWPGGDHEHAPVLAHLGTLLARHGPRLGEEIHILPDLAGNRAPRSDPLARGVISGLTLDRGFDALCTLYWRAAVSLALGVRQILGHMGCSNPEDPIAMTGGFARSPLLTQLFADVTGRRVLCHADRDPVLLGTASAAFCAMNPGTSLEQTVRRMTGATVRFTPDSVAHRQYDRDFRIFQLMQAQRSEIVQLVEQA